VGKASQILGGLLLLLLGALAATRGIHGDAPEVAFAVVALALVSVGSFLIGGAWRAGLAAAIFMAVGTVRQGVGGTGEDALARIALVACLAALAGWLRDYEPGSDVGPLDGLLAVGSMVLISLALGVLAPVPRPGPSFHQTGVLILLYLSTPPFELAAGLTVLSRGGRLGTFIRSRYGGRPGLSGMIATGAMAGVGLLLLSSVAVVIESSLLGIKVVPNNPFVYSPHLSGAAPLWSVVALIGAVVILAPLAEELLFRGLLFGGLGTRIGLWPAALLSAVIFGAAHLNATLFVGLALAGLALNGLYWRHRSLWVSTAAHATLNAVSVVLALLAR
jgi:membrane protease YdiL (CAAX protease family)